MIPLNSPTNLLHSDRMGQRDDRWLEAFALARYALEAKGVRCLTCGRRLWGEIGKRRYCDGTCRRRWLRRRDRWKARLRDAGEDCPYCGSDV